MDVFIQSEKTLSLSASCHWFYSTLSTARFFRVLLVVKIYLLGKQQIQQQIQLLLVTFMSQRNVFSNQINTFGHKSDVVMMI